MNAQTDAQLLRVYAESRSEAAFAELVRRHIDLIHSAAVRMVCDSHLAEDVTQAVFVALAKNAGRLSNHAVLSGWLHRTAQNIAAQTVRSEVRSRIREQEASAMNDPLSADSETSWEHIMPHVDAALGELSESDRDAVLLRYFEKKSAQEMAERFGISAEAAQKRLNRAMDRLRDFLARRGVAIGSSALVITVSAHAVQAAPAGLAVTICATALAGSAASTSAIIAMTTLQKTIVGAALAVAVGAGIYTTTQSARLRDQVSAVQQQQAPLDAQIRQLQRERDDVTNQLAMLLAENSRLKSYSNQNELLKLRGKVGSLQKEKQALEAGRKPALEKGFGALGEYLPVESAANVGNKTPEALLQTFIFAMRNGNMPLLAKLDVPFAGQSKPGEIDKVISPENAAAFGMIQAAFTNAAGFRLSSKPANGGDSYDVRLDAEPLPDSADDSIKNFFLSLRLERKEGAWTIGTSADDSSDSKGR